METVVVDLNFRSDIAGGQRKRWKYILTQADIVARRFFSGQYPSESEAVRTAIVNQLGRDQSGKWKSVPNAAEIVESCKNQLSKSKRNGKESYGLQQFLLLLSPTEKSALDTIAEFHDLEGRMAAVRFCIRMEAASLGFTPKGGSW